MSNFLQHFLGKGSGRGPPGPPGPPSPITPDAWLRLKFFHRQGCSRISRFNWLTFLLKRALHFATKLNTRDIQKCNCFSVPSYDVFASTRKYFTRQRRPVFTDWQIRETRGRVCFLSWSTIMATIDHFTVVDGSEAEGDLVLIQTFLLYYVNQVFPYAN